MTEQGGRVSPAVYRRRRLVVGLAALIVLLVLFWGITSLINGFSGNSGNNPAGATDSPAASATSASGESGAASPSASPSAPASLPGPTAVAVCEPAQLSLVASTDAPSYGSGQVPTLILTVTNTSATACQANLGTSQMEFLITQGEDRVFSSTDCRQNPQDLQRTLAPGVSEQANFPWPRTRSVPGCTAVPQAPSAGGGTYNLIVKLGTMTSQPQQFSLTS